MKQEELKETILRETNKVVERWTKNPSPAIKKLWEYSRTFREKQEREEAELLARLSPEELEFRKWLETVMSKMAGYLSMHHFSSEKEMKDYINNGNKVLKPFMDELVKHSEAELKKFLTSSDWDFICSSYRIYKMKRIVPLQHVAIH